MDEFRENEDARLIIKNKLRQNFDGKIVRKDLTKKIKEGANVPVYVLEFLLGQYCSSDDDEVIEQGVQNVKRILADNFVRPDEAQKILSIGYGFNDSHIQPKLISQIKNGGKPIVVITKGATDECLRLVADANVQKYLILEENGTQTKVTSNVGEYTVTGCVWSLDELMKVW